MRYSTYILITMAFVAASCKSSTNIPVTTNTIAKEQKSNGTSFCQTDSYDGNKFAMQLFERVCTNQEQENLCISPVSAMWALSMVANGASDNTLRQILEVLGRSHPDLINQNNCQNGLITTLQTDKERTQLSIANSIWINKNLSVKQSFIDANKKYYDAQVENVTFNNNTAAKINDWCSKKTNGKIDSILGELDDNSKMLLINALYFKSQWTKPFTNGLTTDEIFTKENGDSINVRMMKQRYSTGYFENNDIQLVTKSLGNGDFEMLFILPRKGKSIHETANALAQNYTEYRKQMNYNTEVLLSLPKFKSEYGTSLKETLIQMGMTDAFDSQAKFDKISKAPLFIDDVIQKSCIAVDEEGVEAAAATAVMMVGMSMHRPSQPKIVTLDRPYIYIIAENISNSKNILFIGKAGAPKFE